MCIIVFVTLYFIASPALKSVFVTYFVSVSMTGGLEIGKRRERKRQEVSHVTQAAGRPEIKRKREERRRERKKIRIRSI